MVSFCYRKDIVNRLSKDRFARNAASLGAAGQAVRSLEPSPALDVGSNWLAAYDSLSYVSDAWVPGPARPDRNGDKFSWPRAVAI